MCPSHRHAADIDHVLLRFDRDATSILGGESARRQHEPTRGHRRVGVPPQNVHRPDVVRILLPAVRIVRADLPSLVHQRLVAKPVGDLTRRIVSREGEAQTRPIHDVSSKVVERDGTAGHASIVGRGGAALCAR